MQEAIPRGSSHASPVVRAEKTDKYLIFYLGSEEFGIEVLKVREIIGIQNITPVPQTSAVVKGVINLRGKVIPVLDLRLRLGFDERSHTTSTCIVVLELKAPRGVSLTGVIVDGVCEVATVAKADIEPPPDFGSNVPIHYVSGVAKTKSGVKVLLDIEGMLGVADSADGEQSLRPPKGVSL